jgi:phosphoribosylaminoimidazole-succinocarboxamide synthase
MATFTMMPNTTVARTNVVAKSSRAAAKASRSLSKNAFTGVALKSRDAGAAKAAIRASRVMAVSAPGESLVEKTKGQKPQLEAKIAEAVAQNLQLTETNLGIGPKKVGKVRDLYDCGDLMVGVVTDRQSGFDRMLCAVPFKGQVLNQATVWWMNNTTHITPNAMLASPDPNVIIYKKCNVFPVEFVMRGYLTGSTETSIWKNYEAGNRMFCGNRLDDGWTKNQKLPRNLLTPTTKADDRDESITAEQIVAEGLMSQEDWDKVSQMAKDLFQFGQEEAAKRGLLLVDTKYEFGYDDAGNIFLIDEIHTPDSSRYWVKESYMSRFIAGQEPENIDKEFLRLWYKDRCDPYNDPVLPEAPADLVAELSRRYIMLYETITGTDFQLPPFNIDPSKRMAEATLRAIEEIRARN